LASILLLVAGVATAKKRGFATQGLTTYQPYHHPAAELSLQEAVALAIGHAPTIHLAREQNQFQLGSLHQSTGLFDTSLSFDVGYGLDISHLGPGLLKVEDNKRITWETLSDSIQQLADDLRRLLLETEGMVELPVCDEGLIIVVDGEYLCTPPAGQLNQVNDALWASLADDLGLDSSAQEIIDANRLEADRRIVLLDQLAAEFRANLRALGQIPEFEDVTTISFDLGLTKLFRNGISIRPAIELEAVQIRYRGKPTDIFFGGNGVKDTVNSVVSLRLDIPLGKGRGKVSTGATERAAKFNLDASLETSAHAAASTALATSLAYWDVVAAKQRVDLLYRSVESNEEIYHIGKGLRDAGEMVENDLSQTQAKLAQARAQHIQARQRLLEARLALADAIGLQLASAEEAPLATDDWPDPPGASDLEQLQGPELTEVAYANRNDAAAARFRVESAQVLAGAAKFDLKVKTDLTATLAYRNMYEGGNIKDPSGLVKGWAEALFGWAPGPSAAIGLSFNWPFKNNVARGLYAQTRSLEHRAAISKIDLDRVIGANVETLTLTVPQAVKELEDRESAAKYYEELVKSEIEKFKFGLSGVFDVIFTEQEQVSQLLALVAARQNLAILLSQLRFETGTLVSTRVEDDQMIVEGVQPVGYSF
jgi:outer membrane protein TolC